MHGSTNNLESLVEHLYPMMNSNIQCCHFKKESSWNRFY